MTQETLKLALDALEEAHEIEFWNKQAKAITAIKEALAQPEQEGEEHMKYEDIKDFYQRCQEHPDHQSGMISHSMIQQRLHEEIDDLREFIEQQLKERNT
jgi:hypothetical protein